MTLIGTDPTVIAVRKIDRAARAVQSAHVTADALVGRMIALDPDAVVAAVSALEREARAQRTGWRPVADAELAVLG